MKIIYTRGNRTETLATPGDAAKDLSTGSLRTASSTRCRAATSAAHEFFSAKNVFLVGSIEITNYEHLRILIFDARHQAHSIEIVNPQTMRIYDETSGRGFAVSFVCDDEKGVETRCYIRDEGEDEDRSANARRSKASRYRNSSNTSGEITAADVRTRQ